MECKAVKDSMNIESESKLKDEEIQHNPSDTKSNKSDANSDGIDLQHKKQKFLTNILCEAFRKNFEIFEKIDFCKENGEKDMEKEREKEKEERLCPWITKCCSLLCVICRHCSTDTTQQMTGKIILYCNNQLFFLLHFICIWSCFFFLFFSYLLHYINCITYLHQLSYSFNIILTVHCV